MLVGLEWGGIPVVTVMSCATGIPAAFIRKQRKEYGTKRHAEGPELRGKNVVIVEDVVSSGGQILKTLAMLDNDQVRPTLALRVIDRAMGGKKAWSERRVEFKALFSMSEIEPS